MLNSLRQRPIGLIKSPRSLRVIICIVNMNITVKQCKCLKLVFYPSNSVFLTAMVINKPFFFIFIRQYFGKVPNIKECLILQIFSEQQMPSNDLYSCLLLHFFLVRVFPLRQSCEMFSHFVLLHQNNATSSPGLLSFCPFFWHLYRTD